MVLEELAKRWSANELDDEVLLRSSSEETSKTSTMLRVSELRDRLCLDREAMRDLAAIAKVGVEHLDRDVATETRVVCTIDRGHAAVPELLEHVVLRETERAPACSRRWQASPRIDQLKSTAGLQPLSPRRFIRERNVLSLIPSDRAARDWLLSARASTWRGSHARGRRTSCRLPANREKRARRNRIDIHDAGATGAANRDRADCSTIRGGRQGAADVERTIGAHDGRVGGRRSAGRIPGRCGVDGGGPGRRPVLG